MRQHDLPSDIDDPFGIGYPASGLPAMAGNTVAWNTANRAQYIRLISGGLLSKVTLRVGTASGNICIAVFRNNGQKGINAAPATRLATTGAIACPAAGIQTVNLDSSVRVRKGDWIGFSADNTVASVYAYASAGASLPIEGQAYYQDTAHPLPATPSGLVAGLMRHYVLLGRV